MTCCACGGDGGPEGLYRTTHASEVPEVGTMCGPCARRAGYYFEPLTPGLSPYKLTVEGDLTRRTAGR